MLDRYIPAPWRRWWLVPFSLLFFGIGYAFLPLSSGLSVSPVSLAFILLLALPSFIAFLCFSGTARGVFILLLLGILAISVEALAILTGFPYGEFQYSDQLGYRIFGLVPWVVAFAYLPMLLGAVSLAGQVAGKRGVPLTSALIVVLIDLVVDPAAVAFGLWAWSQPGLYYGIPLINFAGWAVTGFVYTTLLIWLLEVMGSGDSRLPPSVMSSILLILSLWSGFLLQGGLWIPAAIGILLLGTMGWVLFLKPR